MGSFQPTSHKAQRSVANPSLVKLRPVRAKQQLRLALDRDRPALTKGKAFLARINPFEMPYRYHLTLDGLASSPAVSLDIRNLLTHHRIYGQITRFVCVEGWSAIAWWSGLKLDDLLQAYPPLSEAKMGSSGIIGESGLVRESRSVFRDD
jgi:DMSO/TMAO reductase YedYZ molybdopterin-dependent catalytic subunit